MRINRTLMGVGVLMVVLGGCGPAEPPQPEQDRSLPKAACVVCEHNADLACVDVAVGPKTPTCEYQGKRYYFCSEECRKEFLKEPGKYAGK